MNAVVSISSQIMFGLICHVLPVVLILLADETGKRPRFPHSEHRLHLNSGCYDWAVKFGLNGVRVFSKSFLCGVDNFLDEQSDDVAHDICYQSVVRITHRDGTGPIWFVRAILWEEK